jgi:uncharacterized protein (TIGR03437 family)
MKRLNRLLLLCFLGFLGGQPASAQALTSIRIGMSVPDVRFLVDGQLYITTQNFVWPEGSTHTVQFPQALDPNEQNSYQVHPSGLARYSFSGWVITSTIPVDAPAGTVIYITASRNLTELRGNVDKEFPVFLEFPGATTAAGCTPQVEVDQIDRQGVILIDSACFAQSNIIWLKAGTHRFRAFAYPGYYFRGMLFGNGLQVRPPFFDMDIQSSLNLGPVFDRAKRVRFSTNPPGLQVLVDRAPITPDAPVVFDPLNTNGYCGPALIPIKTPLGIKPLCAGDFDFVPGSSHQYGAQPLQTDAFGENWIFDKFDNGSGQNSVYLTPSNVYVRDDFQAKFIRGVRSNVDSSTVGLRIDIDGSTALPTPHYGFIWAEGSTHHLNPPATQRDAAGRVWKFVSWSDGGEREHDVTVPLGAGGFRVTATFEVLGQVRVTSTPPGLTLKVNGSSCVAPCTFDQDPGTTLAVEAPQNVALGEGSRYEFDTWAGRSASLTQEAVFDSSVQVYNAEYHGSHRILAYSDPEPGAKFQFTPESADGFFPEGATVQIKVVPNPGFKFLIWGEDLSSKSSQEQLVVAGPTSVVAKMEKVPFIAPAGIRNAAGDTPDGTVAPGSMISIYGENLADTLEIGPSNPLAQAIGNIYVTVNDRLLPLIFVSPQQINAQLLSTLGDGEYTLIVHNTGKADIPGTFQVKRNAPGVFYNITPDGMPLAAALHQDGTPITQQSPAHKGETISLFGTGLGSYDRPTIDGFLLPATEVYKLLDPVKALVGVPQPGAPAGANAATAPLAVRDPAFAGGAAGMVGTNLIKLALDADLPPSKILELSVTVNGSQSNRVQLPVE